jgi:predicted amidohydrolase YtcJ
METAPAAPAAPVPRTMPGSRAAAVSVPGFADHHAHLLRSAAGVTFPQGAAAVRDFHLRVAAQGSTPMDVLDPPLRPRLSSGSPARAPGHETRQDGAGLTGRLLAALATAAAAGLVEITEMGMRSWDYLDALTAAQEQGPLPARVRVYLASGLAAESGTADIDARRADCGPWLRLDGVKFYADGWLGPRTCALCQDFADTEDSGLLFTDAAHLARRIAPLAGRGWRIAVHAIGDRAAQAVLDAYDLAWDGDRAAMAAAAPRIEHASVLSAELIARMAAGGVTACIQPSFAVTDASLLGPALGPARSQFAYPYAAMADAGVRMLAGSDYPIEVLEPMAGLARLTAGRCDRTGFGTASSAPDQARLPAAAAFASMTDPAAGRTLLTADPRTAAPAEIDAIEVVGTEPAEFGPVPSGPG